MNINVPSRVSVECLIMTATQPCEMEPEGSTETAITRDEKSLSKSSKWTNPLMLVENLSPELLFSVRRSSRNDGNSL